MRRASAAAVLAIAACVAPGTAWAQSAAASPMAPTGSAGPSLFPSIPGGHAAHIHEGVCPDPGPIVAGLSDVSDQFAVDGQPAGGDTMGAVTSQPVMVSVTTVHMGVKEIADGQHSINVHQSADQMDQYIACGDAGGTLIGGADLAFALAEQNGSGISGTAWVHDRGDGSSTVYLFLTSATTSGTPGASGAPSAAPTGPSMAPGAGGAPSMAPTVAPVPSPAASPAG
jgi:hypothetical protein